MERFWVSEGYSLALFGKARARLVLTNIATRSQRAWEYEWHERQRAEDDAALFASLGHMEEVSLPWNEHSHVAEPAERQERVG